MTLQVVILTATDETPFNSKSPKHLHQLAGHPILNYAIDLANQLSSDTPIIAVNPGLTEMIAQVKGENVHFIHTSPERKSWLSLTEIQPSLKRDTTDLLLLHADTPLIQLESLQQLIKCHKNAGIGLTILTRDDICLENKSIEDESNSYYQLSDFCPLIISVELLTSHLLIVDETTDDTTFNMGFILRCAMATPTFGPK